MRYLNGARGEQEQLRDARTRRPAGALAKKAKTPFPGQSDAYRKAREALLTEEIELRRHMTRLVEQRRALPPGPIISMDYRFKDANGDELGLINLFGGHDALVTYFWMYGPQRERPCPMCTNWLGAVNGNAADIKQRVALKILGRSPSNGTRVRDGARLAAHRFRRDSWGWDYANDLGLIDAQSSEYPALVVA
jgi:predicted dithiol-disulfide oxidoreductase (DUF899 family)